MLPEQLARVKIDRQLKNVGWDIVSRGEYVPGSTCAVTEALMQGNTESDYLLFVDDKAIAVLEAKRGENPLGDDVRAQGASPGLVWTVVPGSDSSCVSRKWQKDIF